MQTITPQNTYNHSGGGGGGGMGVTSAWSPLGNFIEGQAHPNVFAFLQFSLNRGLCIFGFVKFPSHVFFVCFPVVQGFSSRLLCFQRFSG